MADVKKKSFFATLPGILTGLAALIAAITSLYLALRAPQKQPPVQREPSIQHEIPVQPEQGWCCEEGRIIRLTEEQCLQREGRFFLSEIEAERNCQPPETPAQPELGWCCIEGEILRLPEEACAQRGGAFFVSREDVEIHCRREVPLSFRVIPNRARRGQEIELHPSVPLQDVGVFYRGRPLPKKVLEGGRVLLVTVPGDAVSGGYFELEWGEERIRAPEPLIIIE